MAETETKEIAPPKRDYRELVQSLSTKERAVVIELLNTNQTTREVIPDDIDPNDLWVKLGATAKALARIMDATDRLKPFLGRMLIVLQGHPQLYQNLGYDTFNDFMTRGCWDLFGVSRPEAFACKRISEELGDRLNPDEMSEIGMSKLALAATAIRKRVVEGMPPEKREEQIAYWVNAAKNDTVVALKERIADQQLVDAGALDMKSHLMYLTSSVRERFMEFRKEPWVIAKAGANTDSSVLGAMLDECSSWQAEYEEAQR